MTRRHRFYALITAAIVAALAWAAPAQAIDIKVVKSPKGVTAWLIEDTSVPLVSMQFAFRGGSALDPKGKVGLAEMASGLLDEGAGELTSPAFQKRLEDNSIALRFSTSYDSFDGQLRALNENRSEAFDLLNLALTKPRFDPAPVERVRGQMLAEIRREAERPRNIATTRWHAISFPNHPYGRDIDGREETVKAITVADLKDFVAKRLGRDNLIVGVVGDITPKELAPLLDRAFGNLPAHSAPHDIPDTKVSGAGKLVVIKRDIPQTIVVFGQQGVKQDDPDYYAASVMNYIVGGGGLTSRLADEIREKRGLAYSVYTRLVAYDHAGVILGWVATQNARVTQSMKLVRAEWKKLAEAPVPANELEDAKRYLTGSFFTRLNSTSRVAALLVGIQLDRLGIDYLERRNKLINAVTVADIQRVARRLMKPENLTVVMVGDPKGVTAKP